MEKKFGPMMQMAFVVNDLETTQKSKHSSFDGGFLLC